LRLFAANIAVPCSRTSRTSLMGHRWRRSPQLYPHGVLAGDWVSFVPASGHKGHPITFPCPSVTTI
jgi:hypothetical protein